MDVFLAVLFSIQPFSNANGANLANSANVFEKIRGIRPFAKFALKNITYFKPPPNNCILSHDILLQILQHSPRRYF
jgi:hypothetical protein